MSEQRDVIRTATLGAKRQFKRQIVEYRPPIFEETAVLEEKTGEPLGVESKVVGYGDPIMVEVRQPTIAERNEVFSRFTDKEGGGSQLEIILWMAINQTFVPRTDEKVFDAIDIEALRMQPSGGFVDQFGNTALELMNIDEKSARKN